MDGRQNLLQLFTEDYEITPPNSPSRMDEEKDESVSLPVDMSENTFRYQKIRVPLSNLKD